MAAINPALSAQLAKPLAAKDLGPSFGPFSFTVPQIAAGAGTGGGTDQGFARELIAALAKEQSPSTLRVNPPATADTTGPTLQSLADLFAKLAAGQGLGTARGSDFNVSPGGDSSAPPGGTSPGRGGALSPTLGDLLGGAKGRELSPFIRGLLDVLPFLTRVPLPLGRLVDVVRENMTNPLNQPMDNPTPRASSPAPTGVGGDDTGAPASTPAGLSAATEANAAALAHGIIAEAAFGLPPGLTSDVSLSESGGLSAAAAAAAAEGQGEASGIGGVPGSTGDSGEGDAGDSGDGFHRGGPVTKGPPRGPERRARLLEGEYVVNPKAAKLRRTLLDAINRGASKSTLAQLVKAGR